MHRCTVRERDLQTCAQRTCDVASVEAILYFSISEIPTIDPSETFSLCLHFYSPLDQLIAATIVTITFVKVGRSYLPHPHLLKSNIYLVEVSTTFHYKINMLFGYQNDNEMLELSTKCRI